MTDRDASGKFVKGNSGNPGGRPRTDLLLSALIDEAVTREDWLVIIREQKKRAMRGDLKASDWLADRRFGKPTQPSTVSGPDGGPVQISRVEYVLPPEDSGDSNT